VADELVEVTLQGGLKIKLPPADAEAYAAARSKDKAERETLAKKAGEMEALLKAEADAKTKAEEDAKLAKMTSKGEYDKALELMKKQTDDRLRKFAEQARDKEIQARIANHPSVQAMQSADARKELVDLLSLQLRTGCRFDIDTNTLQVMGDGGAVALDSEGKPKQADAWIVQTLDASSLLKTNATPGTGANGQGKPAAPGGKAKVTLADATGGKVPKALLESGNYEIVG
jgi:hypothetical protein